MRVTPDQACMRVNDRVGYDRCGEVTFHRVRIAPFQGPGGDWLCCLSEIKGSVSLTKVVIPGHQADLHATQSDLDTSRA
jgi:hypothetical protein